MMSKILLLIGVPLQSTPVLPLVTARQPMPKSLSGFSHNSGDGALKNISDCLDNQVNDGAVLASLSLFLLY